MSDARPLAPIRYPSNGVPWLEWEDRMVWSCRGCGRSGGLPAMVSVAQFAAALGDLKREHVYCRPVEEWDRRPGVGDALNLGRA